MIVMPCLRGLLAAALLAVLVPGIASAQVVISQVYGGGGNSGATYNQKYVELFNRGGSSQSLGGLSVQYGASAGNFSQKTDLPAVSIPAGGYFLLGLGTGAAGDPLPVTPDATGSWSPAGVSGKVALFNSTTLQACGSTGATPNPCSPAQLALMLDLVGYGAATLFEGSGPAPATSSTAAAMRAAAGCTDTDDNANDLPNAPPSPRNASSAINDCGAPPPPRLSIDDVSDLEGNDGFTDFVFSVTLTNAEGGAVSVDFATIDGTATAGSDYVATSGTLNFTGTEGETQIVTVQVIGDSDPEGNETFSVVLSNPSPGTVSLDPATGTGTIVNDDAFSLTAIHAIQGSGSTSPLEGQVHVAQGIVTGIRSTSFYIQTPDGSDDDDPATSEGLFVFVGFGNVPAWMALGDLVTVRGTVVEFIPPQDIYQLPITQLASVDVIQLDATAQPLPEPVVLNVPLDPNGGLEQLERYEFMRVSIPQFLTTAPTRPGSTDEYFGVIVGNVRPFREPGVDLQDQPLPSEAPANVPLWDFNPELIRVKSNLLVGGAASPIRAGTVLQGLVGVLDYSFRRYTVLTTTAALPTIGLEPGGTAASLPLPQDVTIGGFNVENLSGTGGVTFTRKANKISAVVRNYLHYPDVLGIIEVAGLPTLQTLAGIISTDAGVAADPQYSAHVLADSGSQRLGFLLKTAEVAPGVPRVELLSIEERGAGLGMVCPDGSTTNTDPANGPVGLLNDRAPLIIEARINAANDASYDVIVINNHLKSLIGVDSRDDASGAYACFNDTENPGGGEGRRNRAKRQQNAEYLALLVDELQLENPGKPIVLVGDFNAFEFNDGYADLIGTIAGTPSSDDETVVPDDGLELVSPTLIPLALLVDADQRYSYVFGGNAQVLDHVLINEAVVDTTTAVRKEFARVNADFTYADATDTGVPFRSSDHDPTQAYLTVSAFFTADLNLIGGLDVDEAEVGDSVTFALTLGNDGADAAINPRLLVNLPSTTGFVEHSAPGDWSCAPPSPGGSGSFSCFAATLANAANAAFTFEVELLPAAAATAVELSASAEADSTDPTSPNLAADSVAVAAIEADLALTAIADAATVTRPDAAVVVFTATSNGPDTASNVLLALSVAGLNDSSPVPTVVEPTGWICDAFLVAAGVAEASCSHASLAAGASEFAVSVATDALDGNQLDFSGTLSADTVDPISDNNTAAASVAINTAPVADDASFTVQAAAANGSSVGTVIAVDADDDPLAFAITAGNTDNAFAIDNDGLLTVADSSALAGSFSLTVTVSDGRGGSDTASIAIDVNNPPSVAAASFVIRTGRPVGFEVGQVSASDPDDDPLSYAITAGNTGNAFAIDTAGRITVADSSAIAADFELVVGVDDGRGGSASALITITVEQAPEVIFVDGFEAG
jgi:uncharacterized protein